MTKFIALSLATCALSLSCSLHATEGTITVNKVTGSYIVGLSKLSQDIQVKDSKINTIKTNSMNLMLKNY